MSGQGIYLACHRGSATANAQLAEGAGCDVPLPHHDVSQLHWSARQGAASLSCASKHSPKCCLASGRSAGPDSEAPVGNFELGSGTADHRFAWGAHLERYVRRAGVQHVCARSARCGGRLRRIETRGSDCGAVQTVKRRTFNMRRMAAPLALSGVGSQV